MKDEQWLEELKKSPPYTPNITNYQNRKKLVAPKTKYKIDEIFRKKLIEGVEVVVKNGKYVIR